MTRQRKAQILTIAILALAAGAALLRQSGWRLPGRTPPRQATPEDAIYAMLEAAREGNAAAYLRYFTGALETSIRQAIAESGEEGFGRYLRESNAPIKGIAITAPERLSENAVKARVEYVYQDRNEVQYMYLERTGGAWRITRLDAAQRIPTLVPYGTPVE
jgi:hypothetical protein